MADEGYLRGKKQCALNENGLFIPENPENCCCCIPINIGICVIIIFQFFAVLNALSVLISLLSGIVGTAISLLMIAVALVWGCLLFLRFLCNSDAKELPVYISKCGVLSYIFLVVYCGVAGNQEGLGDNLVGLLLSLYYLGVANRYKDL